jgi:hypothetical protein
MSEFNMEFVSVDNCDGLINGYEGFDLGKGKLTMAGICYPHVVRQTFRSHFDKCKDPLYFQTANAYLE